MLALLTLKRWPSSNAYIEQTKRKVKTCMWEHQGYIRTQNFKKSGIATHKSLCDGHVDFGKPKILATIRGKKLCPG
jgi:hypothetical protein